MSSSGRIKVQRGRFFRPRRPLKARGRLNTPFKPVSSCEYYLDFRNGETKYKCHQVPLTYLSPSGADIKPRAPSPNAPKATQASGSIKGARPRCSTSYASHILGRPSQPYLTHLETWNPKAWTLHHTRDAVNLDLPESWTLARMEECWNLNPKCWNVYLRASTLDSEPLRLNSKHKPWSFTSYTLNHKT
jgi:hypothetical protein